MGHPPSKCTDSPTVAAGSRRAGIVMDEAGLLKHFKPGLSFPGRHVFWDNVKDPDSITYRWEEMRSYYERLLNQPEVLACPLLYDELGLSESTLLNACLQPRMARREEKQRKRMLKQEQRQGELAAHEPPVPWHR